MFLKTVIAEKGLPDMPVCCMNDFTVLSFGQQ